MRVPDQYEKLVLSMDRFDLLNGGIKHRYLPDYLLEPKWCDNYVCFLRAQIERTQFADAHFAR